LSLPLDVCANDGQEEEAKIQFRQGIDLYGQGKFEQASIAFEQAYKLKPSYKILWNIAQVENELGHWAAALEAYTKYLAEGTDKIQRDRLDQVAEEIERLNALVGVISVECPVDGAKIKIDNEARGKTPMASTVFVDVGKHEVVVVKAGKQLFSEVIKVAGGQRVTVEVEVEAETTPRSDPFPLIEKESEDDVEKPGRLWTWVALGVGGAAGIAGGVVGGVAMKKKSELEELCIDDHCPPSSQGDIDTGKRLNLTADILYVVGGVGAVAAVVLFFVEPRLIEDDRVAITPTVSTDSAGFAVYGRF
jgi:tetratricopeptide (TPR) repeat protein